MLRLIAKRIAERGECVLPVEMSQTAFDMLGDINKVKVGDTFQSSEELRMKWQTITDSEGKVWNAAFTDYEEMNKGESSSSINQRIRDVLRITLDTEAVEGLILNPWDKPLFIHKELIRLILDMAKPANGIHFDVGDITKLDVEGIVNRENGNWKLTRSKASTY